jgi:hypothetical protein
MAIRASGGDLHLGAKVLPVEAGEHAVLVPDVKLLLEGDYARSGDDLLIRDSAGDGIFVEGYFALAEPPPLISPDGALLRPELVSTLAGPRAAGEYAQAGPTPEAPPIGQVETLSGTARVVRIGVPLDLAPGDPVYQNDIVETGLASDLVIGFADGTIFSLSANARMVLNSMVYDPAGSSNDLSMSVLQGVFSFVTGQVAPSGGMRVETPVATLGIRGTTVHGVLQSIAGPLTVFLGSSQQGSTAQAFLLDPLTGAQIAVLSSLIAAYTLSGVGASVFERPQSASEQQFLLQRSGTVHDVQSGFEFRYGTGEPIDQPGEVLRTQAGPNLPSGGIGYDQDGGAGGLIDGLLPGLAASPTLLGQDGLNALQAADFDNPDLSSPITALGSVQGAPISGATVPTGPQLAGVSSGDTQLGIPDSLPIGTPTPVPLSASLEDLFGDAVPAPLNLARNSFGFRFGVDGPGSIALDAVEDGAQSGLFDSLTGAPILLFNGENGTVVGRVGSAQGEVAFVAYLEQSGPVSGLENLANGDLWFVQFRAIAHDNPSDPHETTPSGGGEVPEQIVLDFEALVAGAQVTQVFGDGDPRPVEILGINPDLPGRNAAVIFDSASPANSDLDLGTPNETFDGPGVGAGGAAGGANPNDTALGNILIVDDDLQGVPDDAARVGTTLVFDFSAFGSVTLDSLTLIDIESISPSARIAIYDAQNRLLHASEVAPTGDNGVETLAFENISGATRLEIVLNGSGGVDNIAFTPDSFQDEILPLGFTIADANGDQVQQIATITIGDDGPTAFADILPSVLAGGAEVGTDAGSAGLLANDLAGGDGQLAIIGFTYDSDGDGATDTLGLAGETVTTGLGGQLTVGGDGTWTYLPPAVASVPVLEVFDYTVRDGDGDTSTATNQILVTDVLNLGQNLFAIEAPVGANLLFGDAANSNLLDGDPLLAEYDVLTYAEVIDADAAAIEVADSQAGTIETHTLDSVANLAGLDLEGIIGTLDDPLNYSAIL